MHEASAALSSSLKIRRRSLTAAATQSLLHPRGGARLASTRALHAPPRAAELARGAPPPKRLELLQKRLMSVPALVQANSDLGSVCWKAETSKRSRHHLEGRSRALLLEQEPYAERDALALAKSNHEMEAPLLVRPGKAPRASSQSQRRDSSEDALLEDVWLQRWDEIVVLSVLMAM